MRVAVIVDGEKARAVTTNLYGVRFIDGHVVIGNLPLVAPLGGTWPTSAPLAPSEAINLAAWLVAESGITPDGFSVFLTEVWSHETATEAPAAPALSKKRAR